MKVFTRFLILPAVVAVFCQISPADATEQFNEIDAFTSPSVYHSLKIDRSKVYKTYAVINWKEYYNSFNVDAFKLLWGTQKTAYSDTLDLFSRLSPPIKDSVGTQPFTADTLKNLKENTEYYAEFYMNYNRKLYKQEFRFNTPPLPTVAPVGIRFAHRKPQQLTINRVAHVGVYDVSGKLVGGSPELMHRTAFAAYTNSLPAGTYISRFTDAQNHVIASETFTISK